MKGSCLSQQGKSINWLQIDTQVQHKIPAGCFVDKDKSVLKFMCHSKRTRIAKIILKEKGKVRGILCPILFNNMTVIIKTVWYW